MSALSDLTDAVMGMSDSIDSAVAALGSPPDNSPQLAILRDQLAAAKSKLDVAVAAASDGNNTSTGRAARASHNSSVSRFYPTPTSSPVGGKS